MFFGGIVLHMTEKEERRIVYDRIKLLCDTIVVTPNVDVCYEFDA